MSQRRRLSLLLSLNIATIAGLLIVGLRAHSLGVLAAGGDYVADSAALGLGLLAVTIRDRVGERSRATTVVAAINAAALLIVTCTVIIEAVHRLLAGTPPVRGLPVLIVSLIATGVMITGAVILGADAGTEDLHMRSVLLDTLSDALTSAAVAATGGVIYLTHGHYWLDPTVAILIGLVIGYSASRLLRDVHTALRTHTPLDLDTPDNTCSPQHPPQTRRYWPSLRPAHNRSRGPLPPPVDRRTATSSSTDSPVTHRARCGPTQQADSYPPKRRRRVRGPSRSDAGHRGPGRS